MNPKPFNRKGPARVLVMMDQRVIAEVINLTLNHGLYVTQAAKSLSQALALLDDWHPHLAVIDMDLAGDQFMKRASGGVSETSERLPVLALTRRGTSKPSWPPLSRA